jgi:aminoglycoside phosphotransferase (APT) family kinase protein
MPGDAELIQLAARRLGMRNVAVETLTGGSRNRCYAISDASREAVLRIAGEDDRAYAVARAAESLAQQSAAAHGLAPRIFFEDTGLGLTAMERAAGRVWTRELARSAAGAACLGKWLVRLHGLPPPPAMRRVDFVASLDHYVTQLGGDAETLDLLQRARAAGTRLQSGAASVLCHNDLHHLNIIGLDGGLTVVDWEYAGLGDPIMDLAGFVAYHDLDEPAVAALLEAYGEGRTSPSAAGLADARWLFEAVWWAWLELHRRLRSEEPAELRGARQRLVARLGVARVAG